MRVSDEDILTAYALTGSVWKAGARLGLCGQSIHERLTKLDAIKPKRVWSHGENERLKREYALYRNAGKLSELAADMRRTKQFICRKARDLGLTDQRASKPYARVWTALSREQLAPIWEDFKDQSLGLRAYCEVRDYGLTGFTNAMRQHFADEWDHAIELKKNKSTAYRLGRSFEYSVRDRLRKLGYLVMRAPQSRGKADLVAIAPGVVLLVQCKRGGYVGVAEWNELFDLAESTGALAIVAGKHGARQVVYQQITGHKQKGRKGAQPWTPFDPTLKPLVADELAALCERTEKP